MASRKYTNQKHPCMHALHVYYLVLINWLSITYTPYVVHWDAVVYKSPKTLSQGLLIHELYNHHSTVLHMISSVNLANRFKLDLTESNQINNTYVIDTILTQEIHNYALSLVPCQISFYSLSSTKLVWLPVHIHV